MPGHARSTCRSPRGSVQNRHDGAAQQTGYQARASLPGSTAEQESGADQRRPPRAQIRHPVARKDAKKRKALEFDDECGGEIGIKRKNKVTRSPSLTCDVFYSELSATAPESAPLPVVCLL